MVTEGSDLLLQLPEGAFNPEPETVKPDHGQRVRSEYFVFHEDKAEFLIQFLTPQEIDTVIMQFLFLSIENHFRFPELFFTGFKQVFQADGFSLSAIIL